MDIGSGPPSLWSQPDWYESIFAIVIFTCTIIGALLRVFIVEPLKQSNKHTQTALEEIDAKVTKLADEMKSLRITMAEYGESIGNAHRRITASEERIRRLEDIVMTRQGWHE